MASHQEEKPYHPQDTINAALKTTLITGGVGLFASTVQNSLVKQNVGPWAIFTRSGSTIGILGAVGGTYQFVKTASANLREKEDHWNVTLGGFFSGAILGLRARSLPAVLGYGACMATILGTFEYTGGSLAGNQHVEEGDEFDRKTQVRKDYRQPGAQTIEQLGEGRGIYGPGYAERRQQRIKETYGIDVPATPASAS